MPETTVVLGITAALLNAFAFVLYNIQAKAGDSKPNPASWSIWMFTATLNAFSFRDMNGSTALALQFFVGAAGCIGTFFYALVAGKFSRPRANEFWCFLLGLVAMGVWWAFRSAASANVLVVIAFAISFFPTYEGALRDPSKEKPLPWVIWTACFLLATVNVALDGKPPIALFSPLVGFASHASMVPLVTERRKKRFRHA